MSFPSFTAVGCLLGSREGVDEIEWSRLPQFQSEPAGLRGWSQLLFLSSDPLLDEVKMGETFAYPFLLRESGDHALLLSSHSILVEHFFAVSELKARLFSPAVDVSNLVRSLADAPSQYAMSAVLARVEGYGQALRSISLYGSDVGDAKLFRDMLPGLQPYRVTLRKIESGQEALSVGSRGEIGFRFAGRRSLVEVDAALRFLAAGNHIQWTKQLSVHLK